MKLVGNALYVTPAEFPAVWEGWLFMVARRELMPAMVRRRAAHGEKLPGYWELVMARAMESRTGIAPARQVLLLGANGLTAEAELVRWALQREGAAA